MPAKPDDPKLKVDPAKPLLVFNLPNGKTFREGEEVVIDFSLANAKLKGDGGEYRVRYIVDDDEMQWIDRWEAGRVDGLDCPASTRSARTGRARRLALSQWRLQRRDARANGC